MAKTVLIVSSGRTGTQFLARYFDANYPGVVGRHEPRPAYLARLAVNAHAAGALSRERTANLLASRRRRTADRVEADLYVESNPFLWGAVDVFDEVWGAPTVVHVVRDPRDQVRSSLNHGTASGLKAIANRLLPYWYPRVPRQRGGPKRSDWMAVAADFWVMSNTRLGEYGPGCSDYFFVRYEALFDDTHSGLRALCAHLGLDFAGPGSAVDPRQRINRSSREIVNGWRDWSLEQCETLERIAGPLMRQYGYGLEPEWDRLVGERP